MGSLTLPFLHLIMSYIEELLYSAESYGKRDEMFGEVKKIREKHPKLSLEEQYQQAYQNVMKT
tara:strand:- start:512 stop:700 length:189 start_codon:yes stop_codon:yes gene_type:complete